MRILTETTVWGAFSPAEVAAIVAGRSTLFRPKRLVLATGAYEQVLAGAGLDAARRDDGGRLQTLARSYRVTPATASSSPAMARSACRRRWS